MTYLWEQVSGPVDLTLEGATTAEVSFTPSREGEYVFRCKATYPNADHPDRRESHWDAVNVEAASNTCSAPAASAGDDQLLTTAGGLPVTVSLDGSNSSVDPQCSHLVLNAYEWNVVGEPAGSSVTILNADSMQASAELPALGDYVFELVVTDSVGKFGTDRVRVTVAEHTGCAGALEVTVVDADGLAIGDAEVIVVDAGGSAHTSGTDAQGVVTFTGLAEGTRQSITARSSQTVPALPGTGDPDPRPRFETTSVLDICTSVITLPLKLTSSGRAAAPKGTIEAKLPSAFFEMLPHSRRCAGDCTWNSDCAAGYYCEHTLAACQNLCTPKTTLPFYSYSGAEISGQFQFGLVVQALPTGNLTDLDPDSLLSTRFRGGPLPGNLATNDVFLNRIAEAMGVDVWGDSCSTVADCPNNLDFACEVVGGGSKLCREITPLRKIAIDVPAGTARLFLVGGVIDAHLEEFLQVLTPYYVGAQPLDPVAMLATFHTRTERICPLTVEIAEGEVKDITAEIAAIQPASCWKVSVQQEEVVEPLIEPAALVAGNACATDADCQWPDSGMMCLPDPADPASSYCLVPLFRVRLSAPTEVELMPQVAGFDPTLPDADERLCGWIPAQAQHEVLCDRGSGVPEPCDPRQFCDVSVPATAECGFSYGLSLAVLELPPQHPALPEGGRIPVGFAFHKTRQSVAAAIRFLVPSLDLPVLDGASLLGAQLVLRNLRASEDGSYSAVPGRLGTVAATVRDVSSLTLPAWLPLSAVEPVDDAGLVVEVTFDPDDPLEDCASVQFERISLSALDVTPPAPGMQDLPAGVTELALPPEVLKGIRLSRVDRVGGMTVSDRWWRIYAPPGASTLTLPDGLSPFASGDEVLLSVWGGSFTAGFQYDLFPHELVVGEQTRQADESYSFIAP